jgi:uncharacterized protein YdaT
MEDYLNYNSFDPNVMMKKAEGYPQKQAVAIALTKAKKRRKNNGTTKKR